MCSNISIYKINAKKYQYERASGVNCFFWLASYFSQYRVSFMTAFLRIHIFLNIFVFSYFSLLLLEIRALTSDKLKKITGCISVT